MSWFGAVVVPLDNVEKHPDADSLSIARIKEPFETALVIRTEDWVGQTKAVFCPVDGVLDGRESYDWLGTDRRIKARRFRGVFSNGLLLPAKTEWAIGQDVTSEVGLTKYQDQVERMSSGNSDGMEVPGPSGEIKYTDVENILRFKSVLQEGEPVVITEKIHGANFRAVWQNGELHVGTRTRWIKYGNDIWWRAVKQSGLEEKLKWIPNYIVFGEVFGQVQNLKYGRTLDVAFFDVYDMEKPGYLDFNQFRVLCQTYKLPMVPFLHEGPWSTQLFSLAEGKSTLADHIKEGFVVKPMKERYDDRLGRVILKKIGEDYLTSKKV